MNEWPLWGWRGRHLGRLQFSMYRKHCASSLCDSIHFPWGPGRSVQGPPPGWSLGVSAENVKVPGLRAAELGVSLPQAQSFLCIVDIAWLTLRGVQHGVSENTEGWENPAAL